MDSLGPCNYSYPFSVEWVASAGLHIKCTVDAWLQPLSTQQELTIYRLMVMFFYIPSYTTVFMLEHNHCTLCLDLS